MKKLYILLILLIYIVNVNAQGGFTPINQPHGYTNINTGAPSVNIPLWTATSGNISLPISLSYNANGVKTSELPSEVGLSWRLSTGGSITQIVRGLNDLRNDAFSVFVDKDLPKSTLKKIFLGDLDSERDYFVINLPGYSNTFYIEYNEINGSTCNGVYRTFKKSDIKIEEIWLGADQPFYKNGFIITLGDGTKYYFEQIQVHLQYDNPGNPNEMKSIRYSWHLTKIESVNNDVIDIVYNASRDLEGGNLPELEMLYQGDELKEFYQQEVLLKKIISDNEIINFNITDIDSVYTNYQSPYGTGNAIVYTSDSTIIYHSNIDKILTSVEIKHKNDQVKEYEFDYEFASSNNYRFFLSKLTEHSPQGDSLPSYIFSYYDKELLSELYFQGRDFWGFQNCSVPRNLKEINYRFPEISYLKNGALKEVHYPEGKNLKFEYEINTYRMDENTPDFYNLDWKEYIVNIQEVIPPQGNWHQLQGPGLRVKRLIQHDFVEEYIQEYEYTTSGDSSSGRLTYYPFLNYTYDLNGSEETFESWYPIGLEQGQVNYLKVTVYNGGENSSYPTMGVNGKSDYYFEVTKPKNIKVWSYSNWGFPYELLYYNNNVSDYLSKTVVYDINNDTLSINENRFNDPVKSIDIFSENLKIVPRYDEYDTLYYQAIYKIYPYDLKLNNQVSKTFKQGNNSDYVETQQNFVYLRGEETYLSPVTIYGSLSGFEHVKTILFYPQDFTGDGGVFDEMIDRNILSPVIEKQIFGKRNFEFSPMVQIAGEKTNFRFHINTYEDSLIVADNRQIWENGVYKTVQWYDKYDDKGRLLESHGIDSIHNCVVFGYYNTTPVAVISNSTIDQIGSILTASDSIIINNPSSDIELRTVINKLRDGLPGAFVSSNTYNPLIGKTSETDANGISVYYEYDDFGRLLKVKDQDEITVKEYEYNYKYSSAKYPPTPISDWLLTPGDVQQTDPINWGDTITITWDNDVIIKGELIDIDYETGSSVCSVYRIADNIPNVNGQYSWITELISCSEIISNSEGRIIISASEDSTKSDTSEYPIKIVPNWLISPSDQPGGVPYNKDDPFTIVWDTAFSIPGDYINIEFNTHQCGTINIATNVDKTLGTYTFLPFKLRCFRFNDVVDGVIKIYSTNVPSIYDESRTITIKEEGIIPMSTTIEKDN